MPDSFAAFPGQNTYIDLDKKLAFLALHKTVHFYQRAVDLEIPASLCRSSLPRRMPS